jgi:hypothetical protein
MTKNLPLATRVSTGTVMRAAYNFEHNTGRWPTREDLVVQLAATDAAVRAALLELRRQRIFRDRIRRGERCWMPWDEAR